MVVTNSQYRNFKSLDRMTLMETSDFTHTYSSKVPIVMKDNYAYINLESVIKFANDNDILNLEQAIHEISQDHNIDRNIIRLTAFEESLILYEELQKLVLDLKHNNVKVFLEQSDEVKSILEEDTPKFAPDTTGFSYMHSGNIGDRPETVARISNQVADDVAKIFNDIKKMENTKENQDSAANMRDGADMFLRNYEGGRAAMNRHFLKGKGVQYHGDFIGPQGASYGFNSHDIEVLKKMQSGDYKTPSGKEPTKFQKLALKGMSKMYLTQLENEINTTEDKFTDLADRIKNEQIPRNIIARLIAKFRSLYNNIMVKLRIGTYQREADAKFANKIHELSREDNGNKTAFKMGFHMVKHGLTTYLRTLAEKILWFIDKLLQKLQNASNTAGDKIKEWFGRKLNSAQTQQTQGGK